MTGSEVEVRPGALAVRTDQVEWDDRQRAALAQLGLADAPKGDLAVFMHVCQRSGLDPFARQIHMIGRWDGKAKRTRWTIQTGIDGLRVIARRTGQFRGRGGPWWCGEDGQWRDVWLAPGPPAAARACVYRAGEEEPTYGVALWQEYAQTGQDGRPVALWASKPAHMLGKVAEALALKAAFPQDMGGLYTDDEMPHAPALHEVKQSDSAGRQPATVHSVPDADRPSRADWDALEAAFSELAAVQGVAVPGYPQQAKVISGIVGRTVTTFKQLTRADVASVLAGLREATEAAADAAYLDSRGTDTKPAEEAGIIDAELVEDPA